MAKQKPKQKRTRTVSMRLDDDEYQYLDQMRKKMQRGRYMRSLLKNEIRQIPELNIAAYRELARMSSNVNQVAKHLNCGEPVPFTEIRELMIALRDQLIGAKSL